MKYAKLLACTLPCIAAASATAGESTSAAGACPISSAAGAARYSREHQIPTEADPNDPVHRMVTPGGMILDVPKWVAATDELTIVARDESALCFELLTYARDRDKCALTGVADAESSGAYLFRQDGIAVRFTFLGADQVRVEPIGDGYRSRCESHGEIEPAIYMAR